MYTCCVPFEDRWFPQNKLTFWCPSSNNKFIIESCIIQMNCINTLNVIFAIFTCYQIIQYYIRTIRVSWFWAFKWNLRRWDCELCHRIAKESRLWVIPSSYLFWDNTYNIDCWFSLFISNSVWLRDIKRYFPLYKGGYLLHWCDCAKKVQSFKNY